MVLDNIFGRLLLRIWAKDDLADQVSCYSKGCHKDDTNQVTHVKEHNLTKYHMLPNSEADAPKPGEARYSEAVPRLLQFRKDHLHLLFLVDLLYLHRYLVNCI